MAVGQLYFTSPKGSRRRRVGLLAQKPLGSTRNCLSEVQVVQPGPHSATCHCLWCVEDNAVHLMGPVEEV